MTTHFISNISHATFFISKRGHHASFRTRWPPADLAAGEFADTDAAVRVRPPVRLPVRLPVRPSIRGGSLCLPLACHSRRALCHRRRLRRTDGRGRGDL